VDQQVSAPRGRRKRAHGVNVTGANVVAIDN
jgi:hypothetical protein